MLWTWINARRVHASSWYTGTKVDQSDKIVSQAMSASRAKLMVILLALLALPAFADLEVIELWSRATVPAASTGVVYGQLQNTGKDPLAIVAVESPIAERAEIHRSTSRDGMMGMEHVQRIELAPGEKLRLEPGGMHIMLVGLKDGLEQGKTFRIDVLTEDETLTANVATGTVGQMEAPRN